MVADDLNNPHDVYFREAFSRPELVRDFVENYLPAEISKLFNLDTLEQLPDSFIDNDLREHLSDILYQVQAWDERPTLFYFLFEHKSRPEQDTPFQLLRYMVLKWDKDLRQGIAPRPIIPIVLYHGRQQWHIPTDFGDLFPGPEPLRGYWPSFRYELRDLSHYSDAEIRGAALLQITLRMLKHIYDRNLVEQLPAIFSLFQALANSQTALEYLRITLRYLSVTSKDVQEQAIKRTIETLFTTTQGDEIMPTLAEQWIEQGLQQGLQRGILRAGRDSVLDLLNVRFGEVPAGIATKIESIQNADTLRQLLRRAATVATVADFRQLLNTVTEPLLS